jgi:hypothetical protein
VSYKNIDKDILASMYELADFRNTLSYLIFKNDKSIKKYKIYHIGLLNPIKMLTFRKQMVKGNCDLFDIICQFNGSDKLDRLKTDSEAGKDFLSQIDVTLIELGDRLEKETNNVKLLGEGYDLLFSLLDVTTAPLNTKFVGSNVCYRMFDKRMKLMNHQSKQRIEEHEIQPIASNGIHKIVDSVQSSYAYANAPLGEAKKFEL